MYENGNILRHCLQTLYNFMLFCILVHNNGIKNKNEKGRNIMEMDFREMNLLIEGSNETWCSWGKFCPIHWVKWAISFFFAFLQYLSFYIYFILEYWLISSRLFITMIYLKLKRYFECIFIFS